MYPVLSIEFFVLLVMHSLLLFLFFFFFNDTATTEIYTLSLHDALPISSRGCPSSSSTEGICRSNSDCSAEISRLVRDRKSTRLNSSHSQISYAVFCLKKKNKEYVVCQFYQIKSSTTHDSGVSTHRSYCP